MFHGGAHQTLVADMLPNGDYFDRASAFLMMDIIEGYINIKIIVGPFDIGNHMTYIIMTITKGGIYCWSMVRPIKF